jgi:phosphoheptose isomerase
MTIVARAALDEAALAPDRLRSDAATLSDIERAGELLASTLAAGGGAFSCGNGGSMCDAMHFAEELTGRFGDDRPGTAPGGLADVAIVTAGGRYADRVQELHMKVIHILIELVERRLAPSIYA